MAMDQLANLPIITGREMLLQHDRDIDELKAWRQELRGAWRLITVAIGSSILSAIASIIAIASVLTSHHP